MSKFEEVFEGSIHPVLFDNIFKAATRAIKHNKLPLTMCFTAGKPKTNGIIIIHDIEYGDSYKKKVLFSRGLSSKKYIAMNLEL